MRNFNETLAEYLELYGEYVRGSGEAEHRDIQRKLSWLAAIVRDEDLDLLIAELEDLQEDAELWV